MSIIVAKLLVTRECMLSSFIKKGSLGKAMCNIIDL